MTDLPAVWLATDIAPSALAVGTTKIGGAPDLPHATPWPLRPAYPDAPKRTVHLRASTTAPDSDWPWATPEQCVVFRQEAAERIVAIENPAPLHFIAQINFAEIAAVGPLPAGFPSRGMLSLFYDMTEQPWGFDPLERIGFDVLYSESNENLARLPLPAALEVLHETRCAPSHCVTPEPEGAADTSDDGKDWRCHHVAGWPTPVQDDPRMLCALVTAGHYCGDSEPFRDPNLADIRARASDWVLLLQLGTDEKTGLVLGDGGQLYVLITRDDLAARRFERSHVVLQCY